MLDKCQGKQDRHSALVTGATGYIGSHLVGGLLDAGWQVHVVVRQASSLHMLKNYLQCITVHIHDASMVGMFNVMVAAKPDVVYHLAAATSSEHQMEDVDRMLEANIQFSTQLTEAMYRNGIKYLVNTETFWQYQTGNDIYAPVCLYAATKQAFHDILRYYVDLGYLNALSLVLYDTYGADDPRKKLFSLLKLARQEQRQISMTSGEQIVDVSHVDDVVAAYLRAGEILLSESPKRLNTYAVTSGRRMSLRQFVEIIERETGILMPINWGGKPYRLNEVMKPWLGKPLPGWCPKVELAVGLREVFKGLV
jgi:nucleoside-diphosphate-sugar epimerase